MNLRQHLSRITTSGLYIPELDGLRFIAIALVVIGHTQQLVAMKLGMTMGADETAAFILSRMVVGVELFFVISGFILGLPFAANSLADGPPVNLRSYFLRRITRLEPPYIICMLLLFVLAGSLSIEQGKHLLASLLYLHNVAYGASSTINVVAWSLEVEVQFYILAPLLAALFFWPKSPIFRRGLIVGAAIGNFLLRHLVEWHFGAQPVSLFFYLQYFLAGFLIADLYVTDWKQKQAKSYWADLWVVLAWAAFLGLVAHGPRAMSLITAALLTVIVACSLRGVMTSRVLGFAPIAIIGGACYSIYLLHLPLIHFLMPRLPAIQFGDTVIPNVFAYGLTAVIVIVPLSMLYFLAIERPCMRKEWPVELLNALRARSVLPSSEPDERSNPSGR